MSIFRSKPPWKDAILDEWSIVGMNHYHINGQKRLFVALVKNNICIKEEGPDDEYLWNRLWRKARNTLPKYPEEKK